MSSTDVVSVVVDDVVVMIVFCMYSSFRIGEPNP